MTEYKCGSAKQCQFGDMCKPSYDIGGCYHFKQKKPQTNEEWLDRKSAKEKAEWLFKLTYKCYWCGREYTPRSQSLYNEKECPFKKCMKDKKDFEKWLKEKHNESV